MTREFVTVVSGLPRSGTSMMMGMLEAGGVPVLTDGVRKADEDNPRGYYEFEPVKRTGRDASWLEDARGKAVKIVYRLLYDLPPGYQYRVIFMQRDLGEVLASQRAMLERLGKADDATPDSKMAELFRRQIEEFKAWIEKQPNFSVLEVSYNEILEQPEASLAEVNSFLGGGLDTAAMADVVDTSLYRRRR